MFRRNVSGLIMALALATGMVVGGSPAAHAGGCLGGSQARAAIQSGQAASLSRYTGAILAAVGGGRINGYQLCSAGGHLVWIVQVLTANGRQRTVYCDALTGAISVR